MSKSILFTILSVLFTLVGTLISYIYLTDKSVMKDIATSSASSASLLGTLSIQLDDVKNNQQKLIQKTEKQTEAIAKNTIRYRELKGTVDSINAEVKDLDFNMNLLCNYEQHKWSQHSRCKQ